MKWIVIFALIYFVGGHVVMKDRSESNMVSKVKNMHKDTEDESPQDTPPTQAPQETQAQQPNPPDASEGEEETTTTPAPTTTTPKKSKKKGKKKIEEDDDEEADTTAAPVKGAPAQYTINIVPTQINGAGCYATFTSAYLNAKDVKERNIAFQDLKVCLAPKCDFQDCNKEKKECEKKASSLTPTAKYECWYYWYECISDICSLDM